MIGWVKAQVWTFAAYLLAFTEEPLADLDADDRTTPSRVAWDD